jgi:hypothetical protein
MFHKAVLFTDVPAKDEGEARNNVSQIRAAIIQACKSDRRAFTEEERRLIDFRPPQIKGYYPLPTILYAHPKKGARKIEIYSFDLDLLEKMARFLTGKKLHLTGKDGGKDIKIMDHLVVKDLPFLPRRLLERARYHTVTPLILHDKGRAIDLFFAVEKSEGREGVLEWLKKSLPDAIRMSIKSQLTNRLGKDLSALDFVDDIDIDIEKVDYRWGKYHNDKPPVPRILVTFTSGWELPVFIGHHTGKGFGQLQKYPIRKNHNGGREMFGRKSSEAKVVVKKICRVRV